MTKETSEAIDEAVKRTILELKTANMMKDNSKTPFQKTEEILRDYNALKLSDDRSAFWMAKKIESALDLIAGDPYYQVIIDYYIQGKNREQIAEEFNASTTTISRNKTRLIERIKMVLFSDEAIKEIYS